MPDRLAVPAYDTTRHDRTAPLPSLDLGRLSLPRTRRSPGPEPDRPEGVTVTIGRIEVVNPAPPPPAPTPSGPRRATHAPLLTDYLRTRSRP